MVNQSIRDAIAVKPKKLVLNKTSSVKSLEQTLWDAKDKMRGHLEAGEFKQIVHGLVSLGYVSVTFEERRKWLDVATADEPGDNYVTNPDRWNPVPKIGTSTPPTLSTGRPRRFDGRSTPVAV